MKRFNLLYKRLKKLIVVSLIFTSWSLINPTRLSEYNKVSPVNNLLITQRYSEEHKGIDLIDKFNDRRVYSISRCKVVDKGYTGNKSPFITCYDFNNQLYYKYIHITTIFEKNQILDAGDIIGNYNNEGNSKGFHLHLEVYDKQNNFDKDGLKYE